MSSCGPAAGERFQAADGLLEEAQPVGDLAAQHRGRDVADLRLAVAQDPVGGGRVTGGQGDPGQPVGGPRRRAHGQRLRDGDGGRTTAQRLGRDGLDRCRDGVIAAPSQGDGRAASDDPEQAMPDGDRHEVRDDERDLQFLGPHRADRGPRLAHDPGDRPPAGWTVERSPPGAVGRSSRAYLAGRHQARQRQPERRQHAAVSQGSHEPDRSTRRRSEAQLHEGGAGHQGPGRPWRHPTGHPHRPALRRGDVGCLLPRPRPARAGHQPRRRVGDAGRPDRGPDGRPRADLPGGPAGAHRRVRRHQLDDGGVAGRGQARPAGRPRRGRPAQLRRHDARGDQPARHGPAERPAVRDLARGHRQPHRHRASRRTASTSSATR